MAKPEFSEIQFVFEFFHHLRNESTINIKYKIPTLGQECNFDIPYGGSDLIILNNLFIQFKISEYFIYSNTSEIINKTLSKDFLPYYRFHIKYSPNSFQYNNLKQLAKDKNKIVRHVAPMFHKISDFESNSVDNFIQNTIYFDLKDFKNVEIDKNDKHTICYNK